MLGSPGSKPWTTSKLPCWSARWRFARTPTGTPEARPARHRHGRADRDHVGVLAARERSPAGDQVRRAGGRSQHGDRVAERSQLLRDPGDVLVDIVRL